MNKQYWLSILLGVFSINAMETDQKEGGARYLIEREICLYESFYRAAQKEEELWTKDPQRAQKMANDREAKYKIALERLKREEVVWGFLDI